MKPAINFHIITSSSVLRMSIQNIFPTSEDSKVYPDEYILEPSESFDGFEGFRGDIKFHNNSDAKTFIDEMIDLIEKNISLIPEGKGSFINSYSYKHDEGKSCEAQLLWSR